MGCTLRTNRHGYLAIRVWGFMDPQGTVLDSNEGTDFKDSPANRARLAADVACIRAEIDAGRFDYLRWFPSGNKAALFRPATVVVREVTIAEYAETWLAGKAADKDNRRTLVRDYRRHLNHILPALGTVSLMRLSLNDLKEFKDRLRESGLALKTARNIIDATFRALYRDACDAKVIRPEENPFEKIRWPRREEPGPDPYTPEERDGILAFFRDSTHRVRRRYYPLVFTLFWTGMRLSEALGLKWRDVDVRAGTITIRRSRVMGEENAPKTKRSARTIKLHPDVVEVLRQHRGPRIPPPTDPVFVNQNGEAVNGDAFYDWNWKPALEDLSIRLRPVKNTRHTFITTALEQRWSPATAARYCGTSLEMIDKHYAGVIEASLEADLARLPLGTVPRITSNAGKK
jgi:integrase